MKNTRDKKYSLLILLGITGLALFSIFMIYCYYRTSINPNPQTKEDFEIEDTDIVVSERQENYLYIDSYSENNSKFNTNSIFDTDLKLQEALAENNKAIIFKGELEFTEELQNSYKQEILNALYLKNYNKACDFVDEIVKNYNLNDSSYRLYEVFLYEVSELKEYDKKTFIEKKTILENMITPELILFMFLTFEGGEQYSSLTYKESDMILGNAISGVNLSYNGNLTANLYTEMNIRDVYFVTPSNIDGYKIDFKLNNISYRLYYIRYKEDNKLELIRVCNLTDSDPVSYKTFFSMYSE